MAKNITSGVFELFSPDSDIFVSKQNILIVLVLQKFVHSWTVSLNDPLGTPGAL